MLTNWDKKFIGLSEYISGWSKDPSRGVGAVIVDNRNRVVSLGYNGFPTGIDDSQKERYERPIKYQFTEHAERNAIYNANKSLTGCSIYVTLFPCTDCTKGIIQTGMSKVVCPEYNTKDLWSQDFMISEIMLKESGINIIKYLI